MTKGTNVKHFLENPEWAENAILSWSLNAIPIAERWEVLAPSVLERIEAARKVSKAGFTVRIRVDPIVPVPDMKKDYHNLFNLIFNNFKPERITLGSLRGLTSTVNNVKDRSWLTYLSERSGWGLKPSHRVRMEIYKLLIGYLKEYDFYEVGLCKETLAVWDDLAMDWKNNKCNCIF